MNPSALLIVMAAVFAAEPESAGVSHACAVMHATAAGNVEGMVHFEQLDKEVRISGRLTGLSPGRHGIHVHMFGDCSAPDAESAGEHFNPGHSDHGGPGQQNRHVGDLGNIEANADGVANFSLIDDRISLEGVNSIVGRSLVVHAKEDDQKSQPSGESGARVSCGVVGIGAPKK